MAFWKKWFGSQAHAKSSSNTHAKSDTPRREEMEALIDEAARAQFPESAPQEVDATTAARAMTADSISSECTRGSGWFSRDEIHELRESNEESELLRGLQRKLPGASREELLFRYHLSRHVRLAEFELPMFPRSASEVLALGRDPGAEIDDYVKVISQDPSLVRAIIGTAQSPFFSSLATSATLDQAIVRIGLLQVEQIVLIHALRSRLLRVRGFDKLVHKILLHGQKVAISSQAISRQLGGPVADGFLAGLFHDIGKLLLLGVIAQVQKKLSWEAPGALVMDAFDAFHILLGKLACESWELPEAICRAVANHHSAQRASEETLDRSLWLANLLVRSWEDADEDESTQPQNDWLLTETGLDLEELSQLIELVERELQAYEALGIGP